MSQKQAAETIGISLSAWRYYEKNDRTPDGATLYEVCIKFNINPTWLLLGKGPKEAQAEEDTQSHIGPNDFVYINMAEATLSAGNGNLVISEGYKDKYAFRRDWFRTISTTEKDAVLMVVNGDSMFPTIHDRDTVMIDQEKKQISTGKIYAVNIGGDALHIKRLEDRGLTIRILSDNDAYEPFDVPVEDIRIIGQVVWFARQLLAPNHT